jgi:hypothetical protein
MIDASLTHAAVVAHKATGMQITCDALCAPTETCIAAAIRMRIACGKGDPLTLKGKHMFDSFSPGGGYTITRWGHRAYTITRKNKTIRFMDGRAGSSDFRLAARLRFDSGRRPE